MKPCRIFISLFISEASRHVYYTAARCYRPQGKLQYMYDILRNDVQHSTSVYVNIDIYLVMYVRGVFAVSRPNTPD